MVSRPAFVRFLASYVLLIAIPLLVGSVLTGALVGEYEESVQDAQLSLLDQARTVIQGHVEDIRWQTYRISGNTRLLRLLSATDPALARDTLFLKGIVDDLSANLLYNNSLDSTYYVYIRSQGIILTPYSVYQTSDFRDGKTYFRMEGISTDQWHHTLFSDYFRGKFFAARPVTFEDFKNKMMIPYVQSLPVGYSHASGEVEGVVVYLVGDKEFSGLLENIHLPPGGFTYIADADNNIITGLASDRSMHVEPLSLPAGTDSGRFRTRNAGTELFVTYTISPQSGWHYVAALPSAWVFRDVTFLQRISFLSLLCSLLFSVAVAAFIAYRRSEMLTGLFSLIARDEEAEFHAPTGYQSLNVEISRMVERNAEMRRDMQRQREFVYHNYLNRLLHGYFRTRELLSEFQSYVGVTYNETHFQVVTVRLDGYDQVESAEIMDELHKTKVLFKSEMQSAFSGRVQSYEPEETSITFILGSRAPDKDGHERLVLTALASFLQATGTYYNSRIAVGIGKTTIALERLHRSYQQSREALAFCNVSPYGSVVRFSEVESKIETYSYPIELEVRLMNATRSGDQDAVTSILQEIGKDTFGVRTISAERLRLLVFELRSTLAKIANQLEEASLPAALEELSEPFDEDSFALIKKIFLELCSVASARKTSHQERLITGIVNYIEANYADHNLCLGAVASHFSITESYLSYFFKEQTGTNFLAHVETIRIRAAQALLQDPGLSVREVSARVGYNSDKTFRRVFRRARGMSPTEFREELRLRSIV